MVFHNGELFDAEAAAWAIDWQADPQNISNASRYFSNTSTSVVDSATIDVTCSAACPILPRQITHAYFQAPGWAQDRPADFRRLSMSNGPYSLSTWKPGESILLTAFKDYWRGGTPSIEEATLVWSPDPSIRAALVTAGKAQVGFRYWIGKQGRDSQVGFLETTGTVAVKLDARFDGLTSDKRVRRALALAVDCQAPVKAVMGGLGTCRGTPFHRASTGASGEFGPFPFDPAEARRLLTQANAINGAAKKLTLYVQDGTAMEGDLWSVIASYWRAASLDADVTTVDARSFLDLWERGGYSLDTIVPPHEPVQAIGFTHLNELFDASASTVFLTCEEFHASYYCDTQIESLVMEANSSAGEQRELKMREVTAIFRVELPIIWWMSTATVYAVADDLDWSPRPDAMVRIDTMRYSR